MTQTLEHTTGTRPGGAGADITLVNFNMLFVRYYDKVERERHVPLGTLYLTSALEAAGLSVDFRDYQLCPEDDPFAEDAVLRFLDDPAPIIGLSCMANLLPFTILTAKTLKEAYPDRTIVLGGVGPFDVEEQILERFPWIDIISHGEAEVSGPKLVHALRTGGDLRDVPGLVFRHGDEIVRTPPAPRIEDLDSIPGPAYPHIDLAEYEGYNLMSSRGCPYPCTFCSVAPIWGRMPHFRSNQHIIEEMRWLHEEHGVRLFLFQDEFFVASDERARAFSRDLMASGLDVKWKAFGRINLTSTDTMKVMADSGCCEIRYGIESGSDKVLERTEKGFKAADVIPVVSTAVGIFDRVDTFYVWGFPFETMDDFNQTIFQMVSFRMMGARVLPSLLCFLPQTPIYKELGGPDKLEFCEWLFPEYMVTGHEVCDQTKVSIDGEHRSVFDFVRQHPDLFPGFFHYDLEGNVLPKLAILQEMGFYLKDREALITRDVTETDSCGAHSPEAPPSKSRMLRR
ncbi:MAG: radical SAM protein [Armatimonadia bacterium]|nr:radical SAM protein [Armatimonadia bacterium]